jgi:hypothetical protein
MRMFYAPERTGRKTPEIPIGLEFGLKINTGKPEVLLPYCLQSRIGGT